MLGYYESFAAVAAPCLISCTECLGKEDHCLGCNTDRNFVLDGNSCVCKSEFK